MKNLGFLTSENLILDALTCNIKSVPQQDNHELDFIKKLSEKLNAQIKETSKGQSSYPNMILLQGERDNRKFNIRCRYGSDRLGMNISIACTGFITEEFKNALKDLDAWYHISRIDIAVDWIGNFEEAHDLCKQFRIKRGLISSTVGDWEDGLYGRTYDMGSRSSETFLRLYEKGIEMAQKGFKDTDPHHQRLELEFKPIKEKRELMQDFDLTHLLSQSKVGTDLFNHLFAMGIVPIKHDYTIPDDIWISLSHVAVQYRRHFRQAEKDKGWEGITDFFDNVWKLQDLGVI